MIDCGESIEVLGLFAIVCSCQNVFYSGELYISGNILHTWCYGIDLWYASYIMSE